MIELIFIGIGLLSIALILTILLALNYFGIIESIEVSSGASLFDYGSRKIAYRIGKGSYADSSILFTEISSILPKSITVGVYIPKHRLTHLDRAQDQDEETTNETITDAKCLYYLVGALFEKDDQILNDEQTRKLLLEKGYCFGELPNQVDNVVHCRFPYRGVVSVVIGSRRAYNAIDSYIKKNRLCAYPSMEIYDRDTIHYILPLSQQAQFLANIRQTMIANTKDKYLVDELNEISSQSNELKDIPLDHCLKPLNIDPQSKMENQNSEGSDSGSSSTASLFEILN